MAIQLLCSGYLYPCASSSSSRQTPARTDARARLRPLVMRTRICWIPAYERRSFRPHDRRTVRLAEAGQCGSAMIHDGDRLHDSLSQSCKFGFKPHCARDATRVALDEAVTTVSRRARRTSQSLSWASLGLATPERVRLSGLGATTQRSPNFVIGYPRRPGLSSLPTAQWTASHLKCFCTLTGSHPASP